MEKRMQNESRAVYVRPVDVNDLPRDIQEELGGIDTVYAICDDEGTQLALVNGEALAYSVARHHDYEPYRLN